MDMNETPGAFPMGGTRKKRLVIGGAALILILIGAGVYYYNFVMQPRESVTVLESGDELVTAAEGSVVSGFPEYLLLESSARPSRSYSVRYVNDAVRQPVVEYESSLTLKENIQLFGDYLSANGWQFAHLATLEEAPITYYAASKGSEGVNVSFRESPEYKVTVNIAYSAPAE